MRHRGLVRFCLLAAVVLSLGVAPTLAQRDRGTADFVPTDWLYLPIVSQLPPPWIDTSDRQESLDYYRDVYLAAEGVPIWWTGDHASCDAGTTAQAFRNAVQLRINYFRAMAGVPGDVQLRYEFNRKAQQAALMMSANGTLSHNPDSSWQCYTVEGDQAAGSSNLCLGCYGPSAISAYMHDGGSSNYAVGHRRWILYPRTENMGTGDIPWTDGYWSSNALWVFDEYRPRPETREEYVAWPPPGYVPWQVVFPRWSFTYNGADFSTATVAMSSGGHGIPVAVLPVVNGYGENTLVWEPDLSFSGPPPGDTAYNVTVQGVKVDGTPRNFAYQVIVFDPGVADTAPDAMPGGFLGEPPVLSDD